MIRELDNGIQQLQIIAYGIDLPADVMALDALVSFFEGEGGIINWNYHPA